MSNSERGIKSSFAIDEVGLRNYKDEIMSLVESVGLNSGDIDKADVWLGLRLGDKLLGCMALERRGDLVYIQSLAVDKRYRRQGIARALVGTGFENYLSSGDTMVALTLFWNIKVYESMGFHKVDAAEMKKRDDVAGREKHKHCVALVRNKYNDS